LRNERCGSERHTYIKERRNLLQKNYIAKSREKMKSCTILLLLLSIVYSARASTTPVETEKYHVTSTTSGVVSTVAGLKDSTNTADGIDATKAQVLAPRSVALYKDGNFLIAAANKIHRVTASTGIITTVAGTGVLGDSGDGGLATAATLSGPQGVCLDTNGNIFIADTANNKIRKVTVSTGVITTVAGNGDPLFGGDDGAATSAGLNKPEDVAVDSSGNIFIADTANFRIRKVTASTGTITTIAGTGVISDGFTRTSFVATKYYLAGPSGVTLDTSGNVFIAGGLLDNCVFKVTASTGKISVVAGDKPFFTSGGNLLYNGDDILATLAGIYNPNKVALDASGNMLISAENRIRKVTASTGLITTVAGTGYSSNYGADSTSATEVAIGNPTGVAFDSLGNFYYCDSLGGVVRKVTYSGVTSPSASPSKAPTGVSAPATTPTAPSSAGTPTAPSSAGTPTTSSSTGSQSSATGHVAQMLHMAVILLGSVLILHLCRDA
jgi:trimeric autotransporter adhesin